MALIGEKNRLHEIRHVKKIARLLSIAIDDQRLFLH
jgi:hypothetical protein